MRHSFNAKQVEKIVEIAFAAGKIAAQFQQSGEFSVMRKSDNSKVTSADIAVSKFIGENLMREFPQIPVICEEGKLSRAENIFWLIDPIDGTSGFIEGNNEFAVNIGLVENNQAIFGLIHAPLFEKGKMIYTDFENKITLRNYHDEQKVLAFKKSSANTLRIVTSPRTKESEIKNYLTQFHNQIGDNFEIERLSSAIKFFRIVENDADLYLHFRESMEWDTAAGQALIEAMGGQVKTISLNQNEFLIGENLSYKKADFLNQKFVSFIS